jgi:hypothetical protein
MEEAVLHQTKKHRHHHHHHHHRHGTCAVSSELRRKQLVLMVTMLPDIFLRATHHSIDSHHCFVRQRLLWGLMTIPDACRRVLVRSPYWNPKYRRVAQIDWTDERVLQHLHRMIQRHQM